MLTPQQIQQGIAKALQDGRDPQEISGYLKSQGVDISKYSDLLAPTATPTSTATATPTPQMQPQNEALCQG